MRGEYDTKSIDRNDSGGNVWSELLVDGYEYDKFTAGKYAQIQQFGRYSIADAQGLAVAGE